MIYIENILLCLIIPLGVSLIFLKGKVRRFLISFMCGMVACLFAAYIGGFIQDVSGLELEDVSVFLSPIIEEFLKFLPVLFYFYLFEPKDDDLMLMAIGIGVGFATFENSSYIIASGAYSIKYILIRGAAVGVMHLTSMVVFAAGINYFKKYGGFSLAGIMGALTLAMSVHALYNLLVSTKNVVSYIGYCLPLVIVLWLYFSYANSKGIFIKKDYVSKGDDLI